MSHESEVSPKLIRTQRDGGVWSVSIDRPEKANALTRAMLHDLRNTFREAAADKEVRVLTLTGSGDRVFCAGADLSELSTDPDDPADAIWDEMSTALATLPILTIALINGPCIGGGMTLALNCDIRLCLPDARFAYPVLRNGVLPGKRDCEKLKDLVGPGRSSMVLLGAETITAQEAETWGLVDRIVERTELVSTAAKLSATARTADRNHLMSIKRLCLGDQL